jgi:hypothetical protein
VRLSETAKCRPQARVHNVRRAIRVNEGRELERERHGGVNAETVRNYRLTLTTRCPCANENPKRPAKPGVFARSLPREKLPNRNTMRFAHSTFVVRMQQNTADFGRRCDPIYATRGISCWFATCRWQARLTRKTREFAFYVVSAGRSDSNRASDAAS